MWRRGGGYLGRGVRARVLPLIQLVPALHQFDDHGVAEVNQLETRDVGSTVHEALQVDVLKTLQGRHRKDGWSPCQRMTSHALFYSRYDDLIQDIEFKISSKSELFVSRGPETAF